MVTIRQQSNLSCVYNLVSSVKSLTLPVMQFPLLQIRVGCLLLLASLMMPLSANGQCPKFFDSSEDYSDSPLWKNCTAGDYTLNIVSDSDLNNYTIDWGDGSPQTTGAFLAAGNSVTHFYPGTIANYTITITANGCNITGLLVMELPVKASIEVPPGGVIQVCAPGDMDFINNSTGNSPNTTYYWDWGDGTNSGVLGSSNAGQTVTHTYQQGTVTCETRVTLIAENFCTTKPSVATFEPVQIWDLDQPGIAASNTLLCWPDSIVSYTNTTYRNCSQPQEGNTSQRFEYWRFIDYFGPGQDSIIDWQPWPPTSPKSVAYPGPGTYSVELRDSSYCGIVSTTVTITIINPPIADLTQDKDTVCLGEAVRFDRVTNAPANIFRWNADDGKGWRKYQGTSQSVIYNTPGDKTVRFAVDVSDGTPSCKDTVALPVHVLEDPIAEFNMSADRGCDLVRSVFSDNSTDAQTWNWDFGNGQTSSVQNPGEIVFDTAGIFVIALQVNSGQGCQAVKRDTVRVIASPDVDFQAPEVCMKDEIQFVNTSILDPNDSVYTWNWNFGDGITAKGENVSHVYFAPGVFQVTLKADSGLCNGTRTKAVQVNPIPTAVYDPTPTIGCAPLEVFFDNRSSGATNFLWQFGDGDSSTVKSPDHIFNNSGPGDRDFTVQLTAISGKGCRDSVEQVITAHPDLAADFDYLSENNCSQVDVQFRNLSSGASSFSWDFGDGGTSDEENPQHAYVNSGSFVANYTVTLVVFNEAGCSDTLIETISITPEARFGFTATPDSGCSPMNVFFTAKAGAAEYQWEFHDQSTATGASTSKTYFNNTAAIRKYTVRLTAKTFDGCIDVQEQQIVVFPDPEAKFQVQPPIGCAPLDVKFTNMSQRMASAYWDLGDGTVYDSTGNVINHEYQNTSNQNVSFDVQLIVTSDAGCTDTSVQQVTAFPGIQATFNDQIRGCSPLQQRFEASGGVQYEWNFGNGETSGQAIDTVTYTNNSATQSRFFDVSLVAVSASGCRDTVTGKVEVYPHPAADMLPDNVKGCAPHTVNFTDQSTGATSLIWQMPDGDYPDNSGSFTHTFNNDQEQLVSYAAGLIAINDQGCRDTVYRNIDVYPKVTARVIHDEEGCSPLRIQFFNLSEHADTYQWDFGPFGQSSDPEPVVVFTNNQNNEVTYPVQLTASSQESGCSHTITTQVTLHPNPVADFTMDRTFACEPAVITFGNGSVGGMQHEWIFGDGDRETNNSPQVKHTYINPGDEPDVHLVEHIAISALGCRDTASKPITIYPRVVALFDPPKDGCEPLNVPVVNRSSGYTQLEWNFSDEKKTVNKEEEAYTFEVGNSDATRFVALVATNAYGCSDTLRHDFVVFASPDVNFTVSPTVRPFENPQFNLVNNTAGNWSYAWDFGDGTYSAQKDPGTKLYGEWGTFIIWLKASDAECIDSMQQSIEVIPPKPVALFDGGGEGCVPVTIQFRDRSIYPVSYFWEFGDGLTSTDPNPLHTYFSPGIYTVRLTVEGPGGDLDTYTIPNPVVVNENALASFTLNPEKAFANDEPVDFTNHSLRADSYHWDFGDGSTSEEESPTHVYQFPGVYDVELIADNRFGCPDTFLIRNAVEIESGGVVDFPNAFTPNIGGPSDGRYDPNDISNDIFFPVHREVNEYHLQIFTRWGELIFESRDVNIGWDGYFKGELLQQEVYVYKVEGRFADGTPFKRVGDVTLLR